MKLKTTAINMKTTVTLALALMVAGIAGAAVNIPSGLTGLWRFENASNLGAATIGNDIMFSNAVYGVQYLGPWTEIGGAGWTSRYSDGSIFQEQSWNYLAVNPGFAPNGGGAYVNEYTVAIDYRGDRGLNSIFQTSWNGNGSDGDLWINGTNYTSATIGVDAAGFSTLTFDASKWHRIVWSVDNGNFFRVYVDGTLYLEGTAQPIDGKFSLYPDKFHLFADDSWEDQWGLVGTVMTWNRALTTEEIAGMGGWIGGAETPTPLEYSNTPEIVSVSPANGETNVAPGFAYHASIFDPVQIVDRNSIQLLLDGVPVTPVITGPSGSVSVGFSAGGLLQAGSVHTYTLIGSVSGGAFTFTNEVTFTVRQNVPSHTYEWRFTNGDLSTSLGNGVMSYADSTTEGLTSFGTTDGITVPHINGSPAKYMFVPEFTSDTDGYRLVFTDSGPNVQGSTQINLYTLLMDVMVPNPWSTADDYMIPFFNTEPYNLNDADFYLRTNGAVGIGSYSANNIVSPNTWFRIAIVADLSANTLQGYVNGSLVFTRTATGLDGRWALYSNQEVGPYPLYPGNMFLFNEGDTGGIYTHELYVSSIAFADRVLSADEIAALGNPNANGIFASGTTSPPDLAIQTSAGGATISWPSNYFGYALQQADSLTAPQWKPVPGITNNSVTLPTASEAKFFRLVQ